MNLLIWPPQESTTFNRQLRWRSEQLNCSRPTHTKRLDYICLHGPSTGQIVFKENPQSEETGHSALQFIEFSSGVNEAL